MGFLGDFHGISWGFSWDLSGILMGGTLSHHPFIDGFFVNHFKPSILGYHHFYGNLDTGWMFGMNNGG